jgi:hypothetical protein
VCEFLRPGFQRLFGKEKFLLGALAGEQNAIRSLERD